VTDIDWNTELRKIEREYDGLPPEPSADQMRIRRDAERRAMERKQDIAMTIGASVRLALVVALAVSLAVWPYPRRCGEGLFAYVGASSVIVIGALWASSWTWRGRLLRMHLLTMAVLVWGVVLVGLEVLPRVGYAKVDAEHPPTWWCGEPPTWAKG
jgi:Na+/H+ antiporter NhaB